MTPETKCIETLIIMFVGDLIVWANKDMFFERKHIGNMPYDTNEKLIGLGV